MNALTDKQRRELHRALLERRSGLLKQLEDSSDGAKPVGLDQPIGRLSRMDAMQQQSMVQANRRTARTRLARIEAALERYDADEYGLCVACEEEIGYARLEARPETPFCITCQGKRETRGE
jgi:DnaK suppressor protein